MDSCIQISIPDIIRSKAPNAHVPAFVVRYLERIVHVEEVNRILRENAGLKDIEFLRAFLSELKCDVQIDGVENIPTSDTPLLFVSNHPLGGLDGMLIIDMISRERKRNLKVVVNDFLLNLKPIAGLFVPVNKVGRQAREYVDMQKTMWESENDILFFPAGLCSRRMKGGICDLEWKSTFLKQAIRHQRDIIPIFFEGRNSNFFYNLAWLRKKLGVKLNIEMLYLADEMFKAKGKHFVMHIGKPISWQTFDESRTVGEWTSYVRNVVDKLSEKQ